MLKNETKLNQTAAFIHYKPVNSITRTQACTLIRKWRIQPVSEPSKLQSMIQNGENHQLKREKIKKGGSNQGTNFAIPTIKPTPK
jgi:hypothetical protein